MFQENRFRDDWFACVTFVETSYLTYSENTSVQLIVCFIDFVLIMAFARDVLPGWADASHKTYESNVIHHDFVQFEKQHSRYKAIFPSIVLSQRCCEVYFSFFYSSEPVMRLDCQILLKLPP